MQMEVNDSNAQIKNIGTSITMMIVKSGRVINRVEFLQFWIFINIKLLVL